MRIPMKFESSVEGAPEFGVPQGVVRFVAVRLVELY
jgi:hypothetical protein